MNKKQEALRRGLRSFIADALHEFEALQERRPAPGEPQAEAARDAAATDLIITDREPAPDSRPRPAATAGQSDPKGSRPAPPQIPRRGSEEARAAAAAADAQPGAASEAWEPPGTAAAIERVSLAAPRIIVPGWTHRRDEVPAIVVPDGCRSDHQEERPSTSSPEPPAVGERSSPPVEEPPPMLPSAPAPMGAPAAAARMEEKETAAAPASVPTDAVPAEDAGRTNIVRGPGRARRRPRRSDPGARRKKPAPRRRTQSGVPANGAGAEQAYGRRGVCFAYFINAECWRVPEAYCNSALQVCITRECPVYQLHREQLEQRFAKKFKHFW